MQRIKVTKYVSIPDRRAIERYRKVPELGPRILFFSGGSALRRLSRTLIEYTHNSIHVITPFDSGGSSAVLRNEFDMLSVGDIRNRLMSLADQSFLGNPEIYTLFSYRFPGNKSNNQLRGELEDMIDGRHELVAQILDPLRKIIRNHLQYFASAASSEFDLKGASVGNLIITGGFLNNRRQIDPVIYLFSKLVEARGVVRPALNCNHHLAARLEDGSVVAGQHRLTGKEKDPLEQKIEELFLVKSLDDPIPVKPAIRDKMRQLITGADMICYPPGSFYTSIIANFLPQGMADVVADSPVMKAYIPNLGPDPEQYGLEIKDQVKTLIRYLQSGCNSQRDIAELLNYIIIDSSVMASEQVDSLKFAREHGVRIIDTPLADPERQGMHEPRLLAEVLLSLP